MARTVLDSALARIVLGMIGAPGGRRGGEGFASSVLRLFVARPALVRPVGRLLLHRSFWSRLPGRFILLPSIPRCSEQCTMRRRTANGTPRRGAVPPKRNAIDGRRTSALSSARGLLVVTPPLRCCRPQIRQRRTGGRGHWPTRSTQRADGDQTKQAYESVLERRDNSAMQHQRMQLSGLRVALLT